MTVGKYAGQIKAGIRDHKSPVIQGHAIIFDVKKEALFNFALFLIPSCEKSADRFLCIYHFRCTKNLTEMDESSSHFLV